MEPRRFAILDWLVPIGFLVALTIPFWTTRLDLAVAERFQTSGGGWEQGATEPWRALKHYGVIPAWVIGVAALGIFAASFRRGEMRAHRRAALYLVLVLAIGPGLVVNDVFKENWGRPRPLDVVELGGDRPYVSPWVKSPKENGGSFASGHAAMGFYLLVPYFLLRRRSRAKALAFLIAGLGYGSLMGLARMIQGAHFLSDILWAFGFVYLTGLALLYAMGLHREAGGGRVSSVPG